MSLEEITTAVEIFYKLPEKEINHIRQLTAEVAELKELIFKLAEPRESDELLSLSDVCKFFGVSKVTITSWRRKGELSNPIVKGRRLFWLKSELIKKG